MTQIMFFGVVFYYKNVSESFKKRIYRHSEATVVKYAGFWMEFGEGSVH